MAEINGLLPQRKVLKELAPARFLRTYLILFIGPLLLLGPLLVRGEVLFWGTPSLQFVPWWQFALDSLRQGILPLWNPLNGMGAPLIANYQIGFFYPPNWLLLLTGAAAGAENSAAGIALGYLLLSIFHFILGGLGMAILLRRLGLGWLGQIVSGLAYGLSGYIVGRLAFYPMVWVAAWLPWIIFYCEQIAGGFSGEGSSGSTKAAWLKLTGCFAMQLLAGHAQLTWYSILLAGVWMLVSRWRAGGWRKAIHALVLLAEGLVLAAALSAVQLVPTFEYLRQSQRADAVSLDVALTYSFWPWRLVTLLAPDFFGNPASGDFWGYASYWEDHLYIGMLPVLLALSSLVLLVKDIIRRRKTPQRDLGLFLWLGVLVTFVLAMGRYTPVFPFLYFYIPTFDMFQASARYLLWAAFAFPILAAVAVERWRSPTGRGLYWFRLATAGTLAVTIGAMLGWILLRQIQVTFIRAAALAGFWALGFGLLTLAIPWVNRRGRMREWRWLVILVTLADLLLTGWTLNPSTPAAYFMGKAASPPVQPGERIFIDRQNEYDLKFARFFRFGDFRPVEDWRTIRDAYLPNLNLLEGVPSANNFDPLVPDGYARWLTIINAAAPDVRAGWLAWAGVGAVEKIDLREPAGVRFDRLEGVSRWHWANCAKIVSGYEHAWQEIEQEMRSVPNPERMIVLEESAQVGSCSAGNPARINLVSEQPDRLVFQVNAETGGWLEIMDVWYPGWVAEVDGTAQTIYRADGLFRAVPVTAGDHQIVVHYRPSGFYFGGLFSILVLFGSILWWTIWGRK